MEANDADVVARARDGDTDAFRALVERHSRGLFHLAYRITGNEQDAEDVVQESFMRAYRKLDDFESRANFGTWLYRIASNFALDLMRARRRRGGSHDTIHPDGVGAGSVEPAAGLTPDRLLYNAEVQQRVAAAMNLLSPNERAAFVLRHYEQQSIAEVGRALGLRENATKQSIFRAVRKLRQALKPVVGQAGKASPTP